MLLDSLPNKNTADEITFPFISVIIPAFNEEQFIESTLETIQQSDYPADKFEVIVIDNGSTDNTKMLAEKNADKTVVLQEGNVGAVRNHGARLAKGDIFAFLDADCQIQTNWLKNIKELLDNSDNTIFGGTYISLSDSNWIERYWLLGHGERKQKDLLGGSIGIRKKDFWSVGGFNESITSGEDTDLSNRLRNNNKIVTITSLLSVKHAGNAKTITSFFLRQVWHSENYLQQPTAALRDPTFLLCVLALLTFLSAILFLFINPKISATLTLVFLTIVSIFSTKRIYYSKTMPKSMTALTQIYCLDLIYVVGRCTGILKSFRRLIA